MPAGFAAGHCIVERSTAMKKNPVLVIMAAGLGSRYGGLKQLDAMDENGHRLIDYAVFDAKRAGFETVFFIIREENHDDFHELIGKRMASSIDVNYIYQSIHALPEGFALPEERKKPLGTGHAVWCCREKIDTPFIVINADDYYGVSAYARMYDYFKQLPEDGRGAYAMAGFRLERTLSEHGTVARGICRLDADDYLLSVDEQTAIEKKGGHICCGETVLEPDTVVSMNMWGFTPDIFAMLDEGLRRFLTSELLSNPQKGEYYLPMEIGRMLDEKRVRVRVLPVSEQWYGVTYQEDKPLVQAALSRKRDAGVYPGQLWNQE